MRVLALDTTTRAGSAALVEDDRVLCEVRGDPARTHAERLPGDLLGLVEAHGTRLADIDLFAVASGPGSFTGLRIGIATMQGLALVGGRRMVGVSALLALAHAAAADAAPGSLVASWMDAHRRDVFSALFRVTPAAPFALERIVELEGPAVADPASTLERWAQWLDNGLVRFAGDGALLYHALIQSHRPSAMSIVEPPLLAGTVGRLAADHARRGDTVDPAGIRPLYVRRPDAEIGREARTAHEAGRER